MRKFARFAALSLSSALALSLFAADLRPLKEPAKIGSVFPATAKLRLVNVWATWCVPCVAEMPDLRAIDETFGAELALVGVSLDDMLPDAKQATAAAFLEKQRIAFPNIYYTGNPDALGAYLKFNGEIPITIVYDRSGKELWRHTGRLKKDETIARLRALLKKR
jgi:thiol-disulfide isomerase/thioredoxin